MSSVRGRVILGAILWSIGLTAVLTVVVTVSRGTWNTIRVVHAHGPLMSVIAVGCMISGFALVRGAVVPLEDMRRRLAQVRAGAERRLEGAYPTEVQPLVDDLNALLAHSEQVVTRAIAKAGDLAHGLKTPLAVLSNEAERLAAGRDPDLAATLLQQLSLMQRQVDYHLAHARAAASGAALHTQCPVATSVDGLRRTLLRLHAARGLVIAAAIPADHTFRGRREDLDEMLGNILDNACKWAKARVSVESSVVNARVIITVDDDGPGLDRSIRDVVLQRGVRADEKVPGSGLGLAIVHDLADLYGGVIALDRSPLGGVRARLDLPAAASSGPTAHLRGA